MSHVTSLPSRRGHLLDPRAVLLAAIVAVLGVKGLHSPGELAGGCLVVLLIAVAAGVPLGAFTRRSTWVLPFCLVALPLVFTFPGRPVGLALRSGWTVSHEGLERFLAITGQSVLCFQLVLLASSVCGAFALVGALGQLGLPGRLVAILRLCLRYMDLLGDELSRLRRARLSRTCQEPGLRFRAATTGGLVGTLFLRSLERAERVEVAMRSRGGSVASDWCPSDWSPKGAERCRRWRAAEFALLAISLLLCGVSWLL